MRESELPCPAPADPHAADLDRQWRELVEELPLAIPGVEVPFGFLLVLPFQASVATLSESQRAGLEPGDVIVAFEGRRIDEANNLPYLAASSRPGTEVELEVWRGGERRKLTARVSELSSPDRAEPRPTRERGNELGLIVALRASPLTSGLGAPFPARAGTTRFVERRPTSRVEAGALVPRGRASWRLRALAHPFAQRLAIEEIG